MIGFGCAIIAPEIFDANAAPGLARATEPSSEVLACQAAGSISRTYNLILDRFAGRPDLEALVLVHQDAEILSADLPRRVRETLRDPKVAVVGCVGGVGVRSIAWWEAPSIAGGYRFRYGEFDGGEFRAPAADDAAQRGSAREVDTVDGVLLCLSPWAVANLRFDEAIGPHWGYDLDICLQARHAGRTVAVADIDLAHRRSLTLIQDVEPWVAAHMRAAEKWEPALSVDPHDEDGWRLRARRAEAEAVVARLYGASLLLQADARSAEHARRLQRYTETRSWKLTQPLRSLNARRRTSGRSSDSSLTPRLAAIRAAASIRLRPDDGSTGSARASHPDGRERS